MPSSSRRYTVMNIGRGVLALLVFFSQFPPLVRWRWHEVILVGGLSVFTLDWFLGVRFVQGRMKAIFFVGGVYCAATVVGLVLSSRHGPRWTLEAIAGVVVVAAVSALGLAVLAGRQTKELDRLIFSEASSIAFFAMMIAIVTVALVDTWLNYHAPSLWVFAAIGGLSWLGSRLALQSRYH